MRAHLIFLRRTGKFFSLWSASPLLDGSWLQVSPILSSKPLAVSPASSPRFTVAGSSHVPYLRWPCSGHSPAARLGRPRFQAHLGSSGTLTPSHLGALVPVGGGEAGSSCPEVGKQVPASGKKQEINKYVGSEKRGMESGQRLAGGTRGAPSPMRILSSCPQNALGKYQLKEIKLNL